MWCAGTSVESLEGQDPALAADMHFFVGDSMWQPGQLEVRSAPHSRACKARRRVSQHHPGPAAEIVTPVIYLNQFAKIF